MPKRSCNFNINLQTKYPSIKQNKTPNAVTSEKFCTNFVIAHGGASDMEQHLRSQKHKLTDQTAASSSSMLDFFKKTDSSSSKDFSVAAAEGTWVYHTVKENHSFRLNDCASSLIRCECVGTYGQRRIYLLCCLSFL